MVSIKSFISFFLLITILFSSSLGLSFAMAQEVFDDTSSSVASTESVTSTYDAVLKAMLIISQVALVGLIFNHFILQRSIRSDGNGREKNVDKLASTSSFYTSKKLVVFLLICCISIFVISTVIILLQSYELGQNLELDILSAFDIVYSTSVGQVWMLRILTSLVIIGIIIFYHIVIRQKYNKNNKLNQRPGQIVYRTNKLDNIFLISILVLSSLNLYSNSMVSHSNSLDSFSSLAVSVDWIHFMSVSIWIGGLFYLGIFFMKRNSVIRNEANNIDKNNIPNFSQKNNLEQMTQGLMYFSFIAITAISVIGITGLYLAFVHLQNLSFLVTSTYGQILIIKLSLAFPMIFIGRYNQIKIYDYSKLIATNKVNIKGNAEHYQDLAIKSSRSLFLKKINKSLKIESVLGILVLVAASFLSVTSPPSLDSFNQNFNPSDTSVPSSTDIIASNVNFLYLVTFLSIIILIFGIMNFRKNQKQIKEVISISTTQRDNDKS
jgi:putative copper export protein